MFYKPREIGEEILMLVASTRGRPFTISMTAQIERYRVFDGQPARIIASMK